MAFPPFLPLAHPLVPTVDRQVGFLKYWWQSCLCQGVESSVLPLLEHSVLFALFGVSSIPLATSLPQLSFPGYNRGTASSIPVTAPCLSSTLLQSSSSLTSPSSSHFYPQMYPGAWCDRKEGFAWFGYLTYGLFHYCSPYFVSSFVLGTPVYTVWSTGHSFVPFLSFRLNGFAR